MPGYDLSTRWGRLRTYLHYLWNDHAYLRLGFKNDHWVSPELVRTNQPWPHQLAEWKKRGIKTVINLRGGFDGSFYALEKDACAKLGLTMVDFVITSREVPIKDRVLGARDLFERIEYPALMHCKSGADRAGIMSVLYAHYRLGLPIEQAVEQLSLKYLHIKQGNTGVLDYVFERYLAEGQPAGLTFTQWVESDAYDPVAMKATFRAGMLGKTLTDQILRRE
ncbi:protein tyrosine phosphatase [Caulobacter sp. B11]|uniref:tyrosine-protein phosphatase n=1 Tax=Caulobacter sp. B11 TaxID=2048899 RepID=UPI000C12E043|nr:tyrosine-protein phosphatase [Caulobacter sp. B11]PHY13448.1 protein tyrosine phosphatase [Caulobacter sp. B11]